MANFISFHLVDTAGTAPDTNASVAFLYYGGRDGVSGKMPPPIQNMGNGVYLAVVPDADAREGIVWVVQTDATPARLTGAVAPAGDELTAFSVEDAGGNLWSGAAPQFISYKDYTGGDRAAPALVRGNRIGVYAFTPSKADAEAGTFYVIQNPPGAYPSFFKGSVINEVIVSTLTFTPSQVSPVAVRLVAARPVVTTTSSVTAPANYTLTPSNPYASTPRVTAVRVISPTVFDLSLDSELATGQYDVRLAEGTWLAQGDYEPNSTRPAPFQATGTAPAVVYAYSVSSNTIRVGFSRAVRMFSSAMMHDALNPANYALQPGSAVQTVVAIDSTTVDLVVSPPLQAGTTYALTVRQILDVPGNMLATATVNLPFGAAPSQSSKPGDVVGDTVLVPAEWRLRTVFPYPTLEFFRRQMLAAVSDSPYIGSKCRCLLFFTQDSSIKALMNQVFNLAFTIPSPELVQKRRTLDVYNEVDALLAPLVPRALRELASLSVSQTYRDMLENAMNSDDYNDRVSAYAAMTLLAAALIV